MEFGFDEFINNIKPFYYMMTTENSTQKLTINQLPSVLFACKGFGQPSEVWLWRQLTGLQNLIPFLICWKYFNQNTYKIDCDYEILKRFEASPEIGLKRWFVRLLNLKSLNFYGTIGKEKRYLCSLLGKLRPHIILCHFGHIGLRLIPVAAKYNIPIVIHFHGLDISSALNNRWYRWSLLKSIPSFSKIIVVGKHQANLLIEMGALDSQINIIPCGVPTDTFSPSKYVDRQPCKFISVGRFVDKKSPLDVIRAFAYCKSQVTNVRLVFIGDGPLLNKAKKLSKDIGVTDDIKFLGDQPNDVVKAELQDSSVYIQHSVKSLDGDMEGWPVSIAEAAACGLPIIATNHASIPDQVIESKTGYLVNEHDWKKFGERMVYLAERPSLRLKFGTAGRNYILNYDTKTQISKLENLLLDTIQS